MNSLSELQAGMFIHFHCRTTVPQKTKFALVVAVELTSALVVLINSALAEFIKLKPDLLSQQLALFPSDYDFLQHDSWLDCSGAHVVNLEDLNSIEIVGGASESLRSQVVKIAEASRTLNRRCKTAISSAFKAS